MSRVCLHRITQINPNCFTISNRLKSVKESLAKLQNFMTAEIQGRLADVTALYKTLF